MIPANMTGPGALSRGANALISTATIRSQTRIGCISASGLKLSARIWYDTPTGVATIPGSHTRCLARSTSNLGASARGHGTRLAVRCSITADTPKPPRGQALPRHCDRLNHPFVRMAVPGLDRNPRPALSSLGSASTAASTQLLVTILRRLPALASLVHRVLRPTTSDTGCDPSRQACSLMPGRRVSSAACRDQRVRSASMVSPMRAPRDASAGASARTTDPAGGWAAGPRVRLLLFPQQLALFLGGPAPDAVRLTGRKRVGQALRTHLALPAHGLGPECFVCARAPRRDREKYLRIRRLACCERPPVGADINCSHEYTSPCHLISGAAILAAACGFSAARVEPRYSSRRKNPLYQVGHSDPWFGRPSEHPTAPCSRRCGRAAGGRIRMPRPAAIRAFSWAGAPALAVSTHPTRG